MLTLADGTFFPLVAGVIPWGRASGPAGLAPEALQERGCSCKVFSQDLPACRVLVSAGIGDISAGLSGATHTYLASSAFGAPQEVQPCVEPPSLGPFKAIGTGSPTSLYAPSPSLRGMEGEVSVTPIERVANCGFLVELLSGGSSGRPCPIR
jgi:hypothetical protein